MKLRILFLALIVIRLIPNLSAQQASHFYGTIGNFPIEMELTNTKGKVSGWYWYPNKSEKLFVEGSLSSDSILKLTESNRRGLFTGLFIGSFNTNYIVAGKWHNPDLTKEFLFQLKLDNNISLFSGRRMELGVSGAEEEAALLGNSKVKGFSKLALIVSILLALAAGLFVYLMVKYRKKVRENPEIIIHERVEKEVHYMNESMIPSVESSVLKGQLFEEFIVHKFLVKKDFFEWDSATSDKKYGEHTPKDNSNPDLIMLFKNERQNWKEKFAVECKFRAGQQNGEVFIDQQHKLRNYQNFMATDKMPTFLALGVGGLPNDPKNLYILPIDKVKEIMSTDELELYRSTKDYFYFDYHKKTLI